MAWGIKYTSSFINQLGETYLVNFAYKDYAGDISSLVLSDAQINYLNNEESALPKNPIIPCECIISIYVKTEDISFENFVTTEDDEIYVTILKDGTHYLFHGFVLAEEGGQQLRDKPYVITIRATDALGLLKDAPLTTSVNTTFVGINSLITFIGGALAKANPELRIRTWCNIYESSMNDRGDSPDNDLFSQAKVDTRTFYKDANTFVSCYDVLNYILANHFVLFYYLGAWNIVRVADLQTTNVLNYVEYDVDGSIMGSGTGDEFNAEIGRDKSIFSINGDGGISLQYAQKQAKLTYDYLIPDNLVNNEKLQNLGAFIAPLSGPGYSAWQLVGWGHFRGTLGAEIPEVVKNAYIKQEFDAFNNVKERYYVIGPGTPGTYIRHLSTYLVVHKDDKVTLSFKHRMSVHLGGGSYSCAGIILYGISSTTYTLSSTNTWVPGSDTPSINRASVPDQTEWEDFSRETPEMPEDGRIVIVFQDRAIGASEYHFGSIDVGYKPYIKGGYFEVKGDFNSITQTQNYKNSIEERILISDSPKKIIAGALYREDGVTLAIPTWYRYGITESKRFTQLAVEGLFNLNWRKFRKIQGSFKGFDYTADTGFIKPFGLMTKFNFTELGDDRLYVCVNPRMNLKTGHWTGTFIEIFKEGEGDGEQEDVHEFNYIF